MSQKNIYARNKKVFTEHFLRGIKPTGSGRLGVEIEHFVVDKNNEAVSYFGPAGVEELLNRLSGKYHEKIFSDNHLIALRRPKCLISLEPAAQLEISLGEFLNIKDFEIEYSRFRSEIDPVLIEMGFKLITLGYQPSSRAESLTLLPKKRYQIMDGHFKQIGGYGINMMRGTAATQVSIDYFSEKDFSAKYRLANILTPLFTFLTDNAPVFEGEKAEKMTRLKIWENVDSIRAGFVPGSFDADFGFDKYADYVLDRPPVFVSNRSGDVYITKEISAREIYKDTEIRDAEAEHALSMFFPYVRLKNFIEIRMADSMPIEYVLGFIALIKGIFYNEKNLAELSDELKDVSENEANAAFKSLKDKGFDATVYGIPVLALLNKLFTAAEAALSEDEKNYLAKLKELTDENYRERPLNLSGEVLCKK